MSFCEILWLRLIQQSLNKLKEKKTKQKNKPKNTKKKQQTKQKTKIKITMIDIQFRKIKLKKKPRI